MAVLSVSISDHCYICTNDGLVCRCILKMDHHCPWYVFGWSLSS